MRDRSPVTIRGVVAVVAIATASAACAGGTDADRPAGDDVVVTPPTTAGTTQLPATTVAPVTTVAPATTVTNVAPATTHVSDLDRDLRLLVVGDSVAASLAADGQRERLVADGGTGVDVLNVGSVACPVILDGNWWFSDGSTIVNPVCDEPGRYDAVVRDFDPDVVLTIFGWPGAGGGQRFEDGTIALPCSPPFDAAWESGYRDLIERLGASTTVVVATIAPIAMDARRPETQCLNDVVRRLPAVVFDLQEWLCPSLDCSSRARLRTDGVHFAEQPDLRREAVEGIVGEVLRLLPPPGPTG